MLTPTHAIHFTIVKKNEFSLGVSSVQLAWHLSAHTFSVAPTIILIDSLVLFDLWNQRIPMMARVPSYCAYNTNDSFETADIQCNAEKSFRVRWRTFGWKEKLYAKAKRVREESRLEACVGLIKPHSSVTVRDMWLELKTSFHVE